MRTEPIDRLITLLLPHTVDASCSFRAAKKEGSEGAKQGNRINRKESMEPEKKRLLHLERKAQKLPEGTKKIKVRTCFVVDTAYA